MENRANDTTGRGRPMSTLGWIAFILLVIGGLNWALVGLFQVDLVATVFGGQEQAASRLVYILVGLATLYCLFAIPRTWKIARDRGAMAGNA